MKECTCKYCIMARRIEASFPGSDRRSKDEKYRIVSDLFSHWEHADCDSSLNKMRIDRALKKLNEMSNLNFIASVRADEKLQEAKNILSGKSSAFPDEDEE